MKVCTTKKPEDPTVLLTQPAAHELSALCMIWAFALKGGKIFPKIVHKGCFRNPSFGRCPLVTDLAGTNLPDKADGKALQDSHCYAGEKHMHFNGADCIQYLLAGVLAA